MTRKSGRSVRAATYVASMAEAALLQTTLTEPPPPAPLRAIPEPPPGAEPLPGAEPPLVDPPRARTTRPEPRVEIPAYDLRAALALERSLGVSHVLAQILVRRGFADAQSAEEFLHPREAHDPGAFTGIDRAAATIGRHIAAANRIVVHGDYDVDGVCATAIMVRALRSLGADVSWFLPSRLEDGYGLSAATVERLAARDTRLLITVDCGITAVEEVALARAAGIDVVVSDHHAPRPDGVLPDCDLVHPAVCGYPCPELCGTGVAHKLAQALGAATAAEDLDLVALATVADLVPLVGENRRLVREGLRALANTPKLGLRALMTVSRCDPSGIDAGALGFRLAPRINAAGRLRRADAGLELLLTDDAARAKEIAAELDRLNGERRAVEERITWDAERLVAEAGERSAYVLAGEGWHPGVIGIVASRIVERYHRPTIVIALDEAGGSAQGSGRSVPGFDLLGALHAGAEHMLRYGGHRAAAGLTIAPERIDALRAAFEHQADLLLTPELRQPVERIDAIVSGAQLGLELAEELTLLEPCGLGNPRSRVLLPGARFANVKTMGEGRHASFSVSSAGARSRAVSFGCDGRVPGGDGVPVDATFRLERNVWNGAVEPRLLLCSARPCAPGEIEVLGEPEDYLTTILDDLQGAVIEAAAIDGRSADGETQQRVVLDRRRESPLGVLRDALAGGGGVLAVCADVPRRLGGLRARTGGFALTSYAALERDPQLAAGYRQVVALDPPSCPVVDAVLRAGAGFLHLAWGEAELRFAEQMHELEFGLRASLVALYRGLKPRQRVAGQELEQLLRGDGPHARSPQLASRLIRVLAELELVSLDRDLPALAVASGAQTALERSPAYRVYAKRYEDGRQFLSSANLPRSA